MSVRSLLIAVSCCILAGAAGAQSVDPILSSWSHGLAEPAGVCGCPIGGDHLRTMRMAGGAVDGTITVMLRSPGGLPVQDIPRQNIRLLVPGMDACSYAIADHDTDPSGRTVFSLPPQLNGVQTGALEVRVNNWPLSGPDDGFHRFTSVDLNSDGAVNLSDVILLAERWFAGGYDPAIDYLFDGVNDLSDIVIFASHLEHRCP